MSKTYKLKQGEKILAEVHNDIQNNGTFFSRAITSTHNSQSQFELTEFTSELPITHGMKIKMYPDANSESNISYLVIDNVLYNLEGDVIAESVNNLVFLKAREGTQESDKWIVEKSGGGGGASWTTYVDELFPQGLYVKNVPLDTGIEIANIDFSLISIILYFEEFDQVSQQNVTYTQGNIVSKEVAIRPDIEINPQGYFPNGKYFIPTYPSEKYSDMDLNFFITNNKLYLGTQYGFGPAINRIIIKIM